MGPETLRGSLYPGEVMCPLILQGLLFFSPPLFAVVLPFNRQTDRQGVFLVPEIDPPISLSHVGFPSQEEVIWLKLAEEPSSKAHSFPFT